ncbi:GNAT family N-acetyltransferase [Bacillus sp. AFS053548]|uniref:GNAT family N-acetyltransferase n=1 Tax=Bacillus sp. AFS053548 TaxID=2033505 RepID=UPI000BFB8452|nr:GNAT family N-acetyltransferase [Bacillus sp. AFS053548]PGM53754.1 GNAT family N-acetyltransferase [Bacillus sp. AFS053548]
MKIQPQKFIINGLQYIIRHAVLTDAKQLSSLRVQIDGETENLDREAGEAFIDQKGFEQLIISDTETLKNLFLVAEVQDKILGFSRCEGSQLKRLSHKVEIGVCVLKEYWGYSIGKNLLKQSISWADTNDLHKMNLSVLETNEKAIKLYEKLGFEVEGVLKNDKLLSDGKFYNTILMGRFKQ